MNKEHYTSLKDIKKGSDDILKKGHHRSIIEDHVKQLDQMKPRLQAAKEAYRKDRSVDNSKLISKTVKKKNELLRGLIDLSSKDPNWKFDIQRSNYRGMLNLIFSCNNEVKHISHVSFKSTAYLSMYRETVKNIASHIPDNVLRQEAYTTIASRFYK